MGSCSRQPSQPKAAAEAKQLKAILNRWDAPCDCSPVLIPCGCTLSLNGKDCRCVPAYKKCEHILELERTFDPADYPLTNEEFHALACQFLHMSGDTYEEPPLPPAATKARVRLRGEWDTFIARAGVVKAGGPVRYALRHPDDVLPGQLDVLSTQGMPCLVRGELVESRRAA